MYREVTSTYRIIDLILLKKGVFRHYLLNRPAGTLYLLALLLCHVVTFYAPQICNLKVQRLAVISEEFTEIELFYSNAFLQTCLFIAYVSSLTFLCRNTGVFLVIYSIVFSSFFNFIKMLLVLWNSTQPEYFILVDLLCCCSNTVAFSSIARDSTPRLSSTILLRMLCMAMFIIIGEYKTNAN